jgi:hypothetical protein
MIVIRAVRGIFNIVFIIATLVSMGSLVEMTYDMAVNAGQESRRGFLSISKLNAQLLGDQGDQ